ncbi:MAG: hypothetical protein JWP76_1103 [Dactylosporangium sp.]|jgi:hypothetical protein|nr:hypothetical protein [Dactylosporangium sp.]
MSVTPGTTLTFDADRLNPEQVTDLVTRYRAYIAVNDSETPAPVDDESWRTAESTGWTLDAVEKLRARLTAHGATAQLAALERAVANGGFVSRAEVYSLAGYAPSRQLKNWTSPVTGAQAALVAAGDLPEDAAAALETEYGPGRGFRPAIGFNVAPEIVKLLREA